MWEWSKPCVKFQIYWFLLKPLTVLLDICEWLFALSLWMGQKKSRSMSLTGIQLVLECNQQRTFYVKEKKIFAWGTRHNGTEMKDFNLQIMLLEYWDKFFSEVKKSRLKGRTFFQNSGNREKRSLIYAEGHFCIFLRLVISLEIRKAMTIWIPLCINSFSILYRE